MEHSLRVSANLNPSTSSDSSSSDDDDDVIKRKRRLDNKSPCRQVVKSSTNEDAKKEEDVKEENIMDIETAKTEPEMEVYVADVEPPMSQEGLEVQSQLEALDCSLHAPGRSGSVSPWKRRAEESDSEASAKRPSSAKRARMRRDEPESQMEPNRWDVSDSSEESDDDSFSELEKHKEQQREEAGSLRGSSRKSKEIVRFSPSKNAGRQGLGVSVFGDSLFENRTQSRSIFSKLKAMEREKSAKVAEEKEIEGMKEELVNGDDALADGEAEIRDIACDEDMKEKTRVARREKYSAPIPLFTKSFFIPKLHQSVLRRAPKYRRDLAHDVLAEALRPGWDGELALASVAVYMDQICCGKFSASLASATRTVFQLVMCDNSPTVTGNTHRDDLFRTLCNISRTKKSEIGPQLLPTFQEVLEVYGGCFEKGTIPTANRTQSPSNSSLDALAMDETEKRELLMKATRNLKRACLFSAERIQHGHELSSVLSPAAVGLDDTDAVFYGIGMCTRVLLSEYGCRLFREVGTLIIALLERVSREHWRDFRIKAAKHAIQHTRRLGLHVELVTRLLPCSTKRSSFLRSDIAFLSLMQWAEGPGSNPQWRDVMGFEPSVAAEKFGTGDVSYCVADVLQLLRRVPELQKNTDDEWACRLSKIIMQTLSDKRILDRRSKGEIGTVHQFLQKLRTCTHRMVFGVPVQDMRLALEATLASVRDLLDASTSAQGEILPQARSELTQTLLPKAIA